MEITDALDRAVVVHAKWKYRLMDAIDSGRSESRVADVRLNDACDFGKWLASLPLTERLTGHYKQVLSLHAEFHLLASNILELALSGQTGEATVSHGVRQSLRGRFVATDHGRARLEKTGGRWRSRQAVKENGTTAICRNGAKSASHKWCRSPFSPFHAIRR